MKVMRKGQLTEVKQVRVGDIYIGRCWLCNSECQCEKLRNGWEKHSPMMRNVKEKQNGTEGNA